MPARSQSTQLELKGGEEQIKGEERKQNKTRGFGFTFDSTIIRERGKD